MIQQECRFCDQVCYSADTGVAFLFISGYCHYKCLEEWQKVSTSQWPSVTKPAIPSNRILKVKPEKYVHKQMSKEEVDKLMDDIIAGRI